MITLVTSIIGFIIGTIFGYILRGLVSKYEIEVKYNIHNVVAMFVLLGWFASVIASICLPEFTVDIAVNGLMGTIVAFCFTKK